MIKLLKKVLKSFTHNQCDICGPTKDKVYTSDKFEDSKYDQCIKCYYK